MSDIAGMGLWRRALLGLALRTIAEVAAAAQPGAVAPSCVNKECHDEPTAEVLLLQLGVESGLNISATVAPAAQAILEASAGRTRASLPLDLLWQALAEVTIERVRQVLLVCMMAVASQLFAIMWMSYRHRASAKNAENSTLPEPTQRIYQRASKPPVG
mmetsp:Transcript_61610/g.115204  ORF Transcript_61610/g.115204 Transcript_61610/m.115204 type:complete len:159 (-) Transcript_61610:42-518(-)